MTQLTPEELTLLQEKMPAALFPEADLRAYAYNRLTPLALCVSQAILEPTIKVINGGFFVQWISEENVIDWLSKGCSIEETERALNRVHVWDFFKRDDSNTDNEIDELCNKIIYRSWKKELPRIVGKNVVVFQSSEPDDYGPTITFWVHR